MPSKTKYRKTPVNERCPWCRRDIMVYRRINGQWWHADRKKEKIEWLCPASKLREAARA